MSLYLRNCLTALQVIRIKRINYFTDLASNLFYRMCSGSKGIYVGQRSAVSSDFLCRYIVPDWKKHAILSHPQVFQRV